VLISSAIKTSIIAMLGKPVGRSWKPIANKDLPHDVAATRKELNRVLATKDDVGWIVGNAKYGVYAFYDYDDEPICVGQTTEQLRVRF